ncbi:peptide deformylase 1A, chloroplastic [Telopea speciosissima]|uniref:peptide deformylase 1A, chloroplastic n=1 Tax=Telopea speciosissima TaxID=54955 RepID=UPI001CC3AC5A|nr:peptide deformylase 1A, chloroplastic [Telopea speciosissima]
MESIHRFSYRILPISIAEKCFRNSKCNRFLRHPSLSIHGNRERFLKLGTSEMTRVFSGDFITRRPYNSSSSTARAGVGWFRGFGEKKPNLPEIVKAGDPVLHEPASDVRVDEIGSEKMQKLIDDMIKVMRKAPGVGLAAPQIGIPLKIIVLEDTKEYISYAPKEETSKQERCPFDLLVILNPKLKRKNNKTALFFEGCLSVDGYRAVVERYLNVEVTGLDRYGQPIKVDASGWQARILQHECDHLDGTIYVDKMVHRTFRTVENLDLPLPIGCPKLGVC